MYAECIEFVLKYLLRIFDVLTISAETLGGWDVLTICTGTQFSGVSSRYWLSMQEPDVMCYLSWVDYMHSDLR